MTNEEYWSSRILKVYNSSELKNKALLEFYMDASKSIRDELYAIAEKYSKKGVLTLSDMYKGKHLKKLKVEYEKIIKNMTKEAEQYEIQLFEDGFTQIIDSMDKFPDDFSVPNKEVMDRLLSEEWLGSNFSERIWENNGKLVTELNKTLLHGIQQGRSAVEIAKSLDAVMGKGFNNAHRLVRTEMMHFYNTAATERYKSAGVKKVKIFVASDERTCEHCMQYNGKVFDIEKAPVLPMHPHCRCTYIPVIEDEKTLQEYEDEFKDLTDGYYTYDEFMKEFKSIDDGFDGADAEDIAKAKELAKKIEELKAKQAEENKIVKLAKSEKIKYNEVKGLDHALTEQEIIDKLGGGDETGGSCASLAFAYIGNKHGLDVTDYRGGKSRKFFSYNAWDIVKMDGIKHQEYEFLKKPLQETAKVIQSLEKGKEYYLIAGRHAAIIRNLKDGAEYLELQSVNCNGWTKFDTDQWAPMSGYGSIEYTLSKRFGCRKAPTRHKVGRETWYTGQSYVSIAEVDSFKDNKDFRDILGYLNTAVDKQKKGVAGSVK